MSDPAGASTRNPEREWYEISVAADAEAVETISELFGRYGFNEGVAIDEPYKQDGDGDNLEIDESKPFTIRTYVADSDFKPEIIEELRASLRLLSGLRPIGELKVSTLKEEDWANAWKEHFQVHAIGERVVIRPPWHEYEPQGDEVVVELDPGMAFGTGLHPTTRLSMLGVEQVVKPGDRVLDVGTGSGILAIGAIKLGAVHADAVDVESVAVDATIDNARRNGVGDRIDMRHGSVGPDQPFQGEYDVVLANIIARILIELSNDLVRQTKDNGYLVLAGIIESREADVIAQFESLGTTVIMRRQSEDWISLVLQKS